MLDKFTAVVYIQVELQQLLSLPAGKNNQLCCCYCCWCLLLPSDRLHYTKKVLGLLLSVTRCFDITTNYSYSEMKSTETGYEN